MTKDLMEFKTPYSKSNKLRRLVWGVVWTCFARSISSLYGDGMETYATSCFWG